jgi:predicted PurR-regulated permease PerM
MLVILGLQLISLAIFSTVFATEYGLRPVIPYYNRFVNNRSLEIVLVLGMAVVVIGFVGLVAGLSLWKQHQFGQLPSEQVPRIVVPAVVFIIAGVQCAFSSFMLGILRLKRRQ